MTLRIPLRYVKGIGPKRAAQLARHGLLTVGDLLYHLPFRYEDWRTLSPIAALRPGEQATTFAEITSVHERRVPQARRYGKVRRGSRVELVLEARARDGTGGVTLVWFHRAAHVRARYKPGQRVVIHGRVEAGPRFIHPEIETLSEAPHGQMSEGFVDRIPALPPGTPTVAPTRVGSVESVGLRRKNELPTSTVAATRVGQLVPMYTRPTGMPEGIMRRLARTAVEEFGELLRDVLPREAISRQGLMDAADALAYVHMPPRDADASALHEARTAAQRTLIFDELFCLQLGMAIRRAAGSRSPGIAFEAPGQSAQVLRRHLPFVLTDAQERVIAQVQADMKSPRPMCRIVQGDVGSGKTVVAVFAALAALDTGYSAAVMVPTEVLAEQHLDTFQELLAPLGLRPLLLTGRLRARERAAVLSAIASDGPALVVGTHALIQEKVRFGRLGLAVIDEQHRFGVVQRDTLWAKGHETAGVERVTPDTLVMTATPIPRTMAMTVYGDLDVSYLDELPAGRQPVATRVIPDGDRERAYLFAREELAQGHQVFVVFPLVEDSDGAPLRAATGMVAELRSVSFAGYAVGLIHGRMGSDEKEDTMRRFKAGEYQVLVCTTVIEVGIDVPNATVMVIEHADRFGLAQLHQLRGRVGRGRARATCYLIASSICPASGYERLRVMEETHDGLGIAEADLRIRGPGEFLGTRQAGLPELRVASLLRDTDLLDAAREEARRFLGEHSDLRDAARSCSSALLHHRWADELGLA